ncbi:ubiquitin-conjugating enzyme E2 [Achlya hypogyna]|uniref:Ubiquitin-conjugating enzyme E2 n=1 Tax=Achlya hypogyna TaxID=1202772 RepID=A0A1V9Z9Y9_ACHHY|nr:ubiquitin-conjugating enzyme E2 [Achlya hypogyna]
MCSRLDLATLRVRKDLNELAKGKFVCDHATTHIDFPDGVDNLLRILIAISITDASSAYVNGDFKFHIEIPKSYPFHPPVVFSMDRVWHPNIDLHTGRVMFAILGKDWRPVLSINTILLGLQLIFLEPSVDFRLNTAAANTFLHNPVAFRKEVDLYNEAVQETLRGGMHGGLLFNTHPRVKLHLEPHPISRKRERGLEADIEHMTISPHDMTDVEIDDDQPLPHSKRHRTS